MVDQEQGIPVPNPPQTHAQGGQQAQRQQDLVTSQVQAPAAQQQGQ